MKKRVLITGAGGDIGGRLVKILLQNEDVELYTTELRDLPENTGRHGIFDVRDDGFFAWLEGVKPQVIIHLASIVKLPSSMSREEAHDIDVKATEKLARTSVELGVEKLVVTSSGAAYGYWDDNPEWISEATPVRGNEDYFYSSHKRQVEELLESYRNDFPQLKQVVLRPGTVLGPNFENPITNMFEKNIISGIAGSQSPFVMIWVDDLVQYIVEAALTDVEGVFNVAGDGTLGLKQIASRLNKPFLPIPSWLIKAVLAVLKPLGLSQYGPEQVKFIQYRPVLSNSKIKSTFKHQPIYNTEQTFEAFLASSDKEYVK